MKKLVAKFMHHLVAERYVSSNTVDAYKRDILQFVEFLTPNQSIQSFGDVTLQHVKEYLKHLRYTVSVSPRSASRKLSALKAFSYYLHTYHAIPLFTRGATFPKLPKHLPKHLSEEQIHALIATAQQDNSALGKRNAVILCMLYACGMRVSELVSLHIDQINFEEHYVQVSGKGSKERIIPIPVELLPMLQQYIQQVHPRLIVNSDQTTEKLFPVVIKNKITALTRSTVLTIIKSLAQKSGLLHTISPHVLRHSLATHLLKKGANLRVLQMLLGHEKLTTVQVYTHMDISHLRGLYDMYHPRAK